MNGIFARILLLDPMAQPLIYVFCFAVGGVVAALTLRVRARLRRVAFLWAAVLLSVAGSTLALGWLSLELAAAAGVLWLPIVLMWLGAAALGAGNLWISAARSNDIRGDASRAWMGFVPLVNLWLFFAPARAGVGAGAAAGPARSRLARRVLDPALVVLALLVGLGANLMSKAIEEAIPEDLAYSPALARMLDQARTVAESFAAEVEATGPQLPLRIDELTRLTDIASEGERLSMTYTVDERIEALNPDFGDALAASLCAPELFGLQIARGGVVAVRYLQPGGETLAVYEIRAEHCGRAL